jgi:hypothetical protein
MFLKGADDSWAQNIFNTVPSKVDPNVASTKTYPQQQRPGLGNLIRAYQMSQQPLTWQGGLGALMQMQPKQIQPSSWASIMNTLPKK